jgi:hypothetical protein
MSLFLRIAYEASSAKKPNHSRDRLRVRAAPDPGLNGTIGFNHYTQFR